MTTRGHRTGGGEGLATRCQFAHIPPVSSQLSLVSLLLFSHTLEEFLLEAITAICDRQVFKSVVPNKLGMTDQHRPICTPA
jgi:hypothetical protein